MQSIRQQRLSILAKSDLNAIKALWSVQLSDFDFEFIRKAESGMVMMTARAGGTGDPFNLGEVSVSRCAVRLKSGETGVGYVKGRNHQHAIHIAIIDALAQTREHAKTIQSQLIHPLHKALQQRHNQQLDKANKSKVEFFTMVRGED